VLVMLLYCLCDVSVAYDALSQINLQSSLLHPPKWFYLTRRLSLCLSDSKCSGPEVLFKTCIAMKFVDDDYDDEVYVKLLSDLNVTILSVYH